MREASLLYVTGDQRVSFMAALEFSNSNEVLPAFVSEVASEQAFSPPEDEVSLAVLRTADASAVTPALAASPSLVGGAAPALPVGEIISGHATAYGPAFNGQSMGCGGTYSSANPTIAAVSPARFAEWPCGTQLEVCGPAGCIVVTRQDACPGCYANLVDLSEAGNELVCGSPPHTCRVTIQVVTVP